MRKITSPLAYHLRPDQSYNGPSYLLISGQWTAGMLEGAVVTATLDGQPIATAVHEGSGKFVFHVPGPAKGNGFRLTLPAGETGNYLPGGTGTLTQHSLYHNNDADPGQTFVGWGGTPGEFHGVSGTGWGRFIWRFQCPGSFPNGRARVTLNVVTYPGATYNVGSDDPDSFDPSATPKFARPGTSPDITGTGTVVMGLSDLQGFVNDGYFEIRYSLGVGQAYMVITAIDWIQDITGTVYYLWNCTPNTGSNAPEQGVVFDRTTVNNICA